MSERRGGTEQYSHILEDHERHTSFQRRRLNSGDCVNKTMQLRQQQSFMFYCSSRVGMTGAFVEEGKINNLRICERDKKLVCCGHLRLNISRIR
jgi:hypothetical protein